MIYSKLAMIEKEKLERKVRFRREEMQCRCNQCGYKWTAPSDWKKPKHCRRCHSLRWDSIELEPVPDLSKYHIEIPELPKCGLCDFRVREADFFQGRIEVALKTHARSFHPGYHERLYQWLGEKPTIFTESMGVHSKWLT